jgi:hypothetical protein
MKQWLTANKVGPYAKTVLSEEREAKKEWIEKFKKKVKELEKDRFIQDQIFMQPSDSIISFYKITTPPEQAAKEAVRTFKHSAREGREMNERAKEVYRNDSFEFELNGKYYLADVELSLDGNDLVVKVLDLYGTKGEEYEKITDPQEYRNVTSYLQTDDKIQDKMMKYSPFRSAGLGLFEDDFDLSNNPLTKRFKKTKNQDLEQSFDNFEYHLDGEKYIADFNVYYNYYHDRNGEIYISDVEIELLDLDKLVDGEYRTVVDDNEKAKVHSAMLTPMRLSQIEYYLELPSTARDEDPYDWDDYYDDDRPDESKTNEQMGVGYVMKTKPSDPLDREPLEM